jgi:hypothetical protein
MCLIVNRQQHFLTLAVDGRADRSVFVVTSVAETVIWVQFEGLGLRAEPPYSFEPFQTRHFELEATQTPLPEAALLYHTKVWTVSFDVSPYTVLPCGLDWPLAKTSVRVSLCLPALSPRAPVVGLAVTER